MLLLVLASFLASTVEVVEAFTIVLAVGLTHGWRAAAVGVAAAAGLLIIVVAALGPALVLIPISVLQVVVGLLLVIFGMQWLRKAIQRRAGLKALHDEDLIFERDMREFAIDGPVDGFDWAGFTLSFKGVFLEGLEVAFIVVTFGANAHHDLAVNAFVLTGLGALAAMVLVLAVGVVVRAPLARVPENDLKFAVGTLLTAFGSFWIGEGVGVRWAGSDAMILGLVVLYGLFAWAASTMLARRAAQPATAQVEPEVAS